MLWNKGAAWLITFGLLFAIVRRLINLVQVWITSRRIATRSRKLDFWLNPLAIAAAIVNAFVHRRDAYAVVPAGAWLPACTGVLLSLAHVDAGHWRLTWALLLISPGTRATTH